VNVKVRFHGMVLWFRPSEPDADFGPLAPLEHCDENGNLRPGAEFQDSFAHVYPDGSVMRYHKQIGTREEIEKL
jgi:hypothetical protein